MITLKNISKGVCAIFITISVIFMIYGILMVNFTLPQVVKPSSNFSVTINEKPLNVTIDIGEFNVILKLEPFKDFIKGINVIGESIKDMF